MVPEVPDYRHVPQKLYATGLYDLRSHDGQGAFTDAVVSTLNGIDPNFRHLKKSASQTHVHRHGEDSTLYLLPDNQARAVDFIGGAGGANPQPGWIVDSFPYTHADAHDPADHGIGGSAPSPTPPQKPYPGDLYFIEKVGMPLEADYTLAGQRLNAGSATWFARTIYDAVVGAMTMDASVAKHRAEWRAALGLPPL